MAMELEKPENQVAVRPDVPCTRERRAVPGHPFRWLLVHEAPLRGIVPRITGRVLHTHQIVGYVSSSLEQCPIARASRRFRRGIKPFACMLTVPVSSLIGLHGFRVEDGDRRTGCIDDKMR